MRTMTNEDKAYISLISEIEKIKENAKYLNGEPPGFGCKWVKGQDGLYEQKEDESLGKDSPFFKKYLQTCTEELGRNLTSEETDKAYDLYRNRYNSIDALYKTAWFRAQGILEKGKLK